MTGDDKRSLSHLPRTIDSTNAIATQLLDNLWIMDDLAEGRDFAVIRTHLLDKFERTLNTKAKSGMMGDCNVHCGLLVD